MNVAVLCGGKGTRLGYEGQKCCVPVAGRPFLAWRAEQLIRCGATSLTFVTTAEHLLEVRNAVGPHKFLIDKGLGPLAAIGLIMHQSEEVWVANGDTLCEHPLWDAQPWSMLVSRNTDLPYNTVQGVDAGLYYIGRGWPPRWRYFVTRARPHHCNTPEALEEAHVAVDRLRHPGRNRGMDKASVG